MEELKAAGLARSIGVSNYLPEHLDWLLETASTPPSINQIEFHPYLQHEALIKYHKEKVSSNLQTSSRSFLTTLPGHFALCLRAPNARHQSRRRPRRRRPRKAGEEVRRQRRRDLLALVH